MGSWRKIGLTLCTITFPMLLVWMIGFVWLGDTPCGGGLSKASQTEFGRSTARHKRALRDNLMDQQMLKEFCQEECDRMKGAAKPAGLPSAATPSGSRAIPKGAD